MSLAEKNVPSAARMACTGKVRATCPLIHDTVSRVRANTISMFRVMHLSAGEDRAQEASHCSGLHAMRERDLSTNRLLCFSLLHRLQVWQAEQ